MANREQEMAPKRNINRWADVILPWLPQLPSSDNKYGVSEKLLATCQVPYWTGFWGRPRCRRPFSPSTFKYYHFWSRTGGLALAVRASALRRQGSSYLYWQEKKSRSAGYLQGCLSASHLSATLIICSLGSSEALPRGCCFQIPSLATPLTLILMQKCWGRYLPARLVLAPVEAGEELLLVSPASDVRLEWKVGVGRFNLLPVDGIILKK